MKTTIRLSSERSDFQRCAQMMTQTDPWISLGFDFNACLKAFEGTGKEVYILETDSGISGFVIHQTCGTFKGYIQTICVSENLRGQGFGLKLLEFSEQKIREYSANLFICVSSFNTGAIKLYEKFGFIKIGDLEDFVKPGFTEILLRKSWGEVLK